MTALIKIATIALIIAGFMWRGMRGAVYSLDWRDRVSEGVRYRFGQITHEGREYDGFVLRFAVPAGRRFVIRRETGFDRFGKALGLAVEPQFGDADFDRRFYVDCEDRAVIDALTAGVGLRNLIRQLDISLRMRDGVLREMRCENGFLDTHIDSKLKSEGSREIDALEWLKPIVEALLAMPVPAAATTDRAFLPRLIVVVMWLLGVLGCTAVWQFCPDRLLDVVALMRASAICGPVLLMLFLGWVLRRLDNSPSRHRVFFFCLAVGMPGFVLCALLALRTLDIVLDRSAVEIVAVRKAELFINAADDYALAFRTDDARLSGHSTLLLNASEYERVQLSWQGQRSRAEAHLLLHSGAMGIAWLDPE